MLQKIVNRIKYGKGDVDSDEKVIMIEHNAVIRGQLNNDHKNLPNIPSESDFFIEYNRERSNQKVDVFNVSSKRNENPRQVDMLLNVHYRTPKHSDVLLVKEMYLVQIDVGKYIRFRFDDRGVYKKNTIYNIGPI